jgi:hypothetical protein
MLSLMVIVEMFSRYFHGIIGHGIVGLGVTEVEITHI